MNIGMILFKQTKDLEIFEILKELREKGLEVVYFPLDKGFDYFVECIQ